MLSLEHAATLVPTERRSVFMPNYIKRVYTFTPLGAGYLGIHRGLVPGFLGIPQSSDARVFFYKVVQCLLVNYTHPTIYFKSLYSVCNAQYNVNAV